MLRTMSENGKSIWKDHTDNLRYVYNCTTHSSTRYSPYHLLFRKKPRLSVGVLLNSNHKRHKQYLEKWSKIIC